MQTFHYNPNLKFERIEIQVVDEYKQKFVLNSPPEISKGQMYLNITTSICGCPQGVKGTLYLNYIGH